MLLSPARTAHFFPGVPLGVLSIGRTVTSKASQGLAAAAVLGLEDLLHAHSQDIGARVMLLNQGGLEVPRDGAAGARADAGPLFVGLVLDMATAEVTPWEQFGPSGARWAPEDRSADGFDYTGAAVGVSYGLRWSELNEAVGLAEEFLDSGFWRTIEALLPPELRAPPQPVSFALHAMGYASRVALILGDSWFPFLDDAEDRALWASPWAHGAEAHGQELAIGAALGLRVASAVHYHDEPELIDLSKAAHDARRSSLGAIRQRIGDDPLYLLLPSYDT